MFDIGDKVVYGTDGVFVVSAYTESPVDKKDARVFYLLKPFCGPDGNMICAPSVGGSVRIRPIITKEDAEIFLESIGAIAEVAVEKEKNRRECYRNAMVNGQTTEYVSIIKTVVRRRAEFLKLKRRLSEADTEYENRAKVCLCGELSAALNMPFSEIESIIMTKIKSEI